MPSGSCRSEGCTLTGALSVTTAVRGAVSLVHGPEGCAHHTMSLILSQSLEQGMVGIPAVHSTCLNGAGVIFGGEEDLRSALRIVLGSSPPLVFVLSTCVSDMIGDDCDAVSKEFPGAPLINIATGGFMGGSFNDGVEKALFAVAATVPPAEPSGREVCLVGEKNLEYAAEAQYTEVSRLLTLLGLTPAFRLVRDMEPGAIQMAGRSSLFILRDPGLSRLGEFLAQRFGAPYIESFPAGFSGTLAFLREVGEATGIDSRPALREERRRQANLLEHFASLRGRPVDLPQHGAKSSLMLGTEIASLLDLNIREGAPPLPIDDPCPVGTTGVAKILHRWRRATRA